MENHSFNILLITDAAESATVNIWPELAAFARQLSLRPQELQMVLSGQDTGPLADLIAERGISVTALKGEKLLYFNPEILVREIASIAENINARYICLFHSMAGCQIGAGLAHALDTDSITGIEKISQRDDGPVFTRSILNSKITMDVMPRRERSVLTILPGAFSPDVPGADNTSAKKGTISDKEITTGSVRFEPIGLTSRGESSVLLEEADVIISAGRGIGTEENIRIIEETAGIFTNGTFACSRPLCDNGWLPYFRQVGSTGKSVSPSLYVACGISGSQQHIAGIKGAKTIVAVNKDPDAAIFSAADYGVVEDLTVFLPLLVQRYRERHGRSDESKD